MKKLISLSVLALLTVNAFAEGSFGICAGYNNMLEVTRITVKEKRSETVDVYHGFFAGLDYSFREVLGDNLVITPGIQIVGDYGKRNQEIDLYPIIDGKVWGQEKDYYLQIPVLVSYEWQLDGWTPYVGLDAKFLVGLASRFTVDKANGRAAYLEDTVINWYARELERQYNRFNFMLGLGCGTMIGDHFQLKLQYDFGLVNRYKGELAQYGYMNEAMLTAGIVMVF